MWGGATRLGEIGYDNAAGADLLAGCPREFLESTARAVSYQINFKPSCTARPAPAPVICPYRGFAICAIGFEKFT